MKSISFEVEHILFISVHLGFKMKSISFEVEHILFIVAQFVFMVKSISFEVEHILFMTEHFGFMMKCILSVKNSIFVESPNTTRKMCGDTHQGLGGNAFHNSMLCASRNAAMHVSPKCCAVCLHTA